MTIDEELTAELKSAMLEKDAARRDVIRQVRSEAGLVATAPGFGGDLDDDFYRAVIGSYVKKMKKSIAEYEGLGERGQVMAEKLTFEVDYLSRWLPTKLGESDTKALVDATIAELGVAGDPSAAGRVMGAIMKSHRDDVDGTLVNQLVKQQLDL